MGPTDEQIAELRRHYARYGASDAVFIGHPKTVERGKAVLALLAEYDTLRARVGELEAGLNALIVAHCGLCRRGMTPERNEYGYWIHVDATVLGDGVRCACLATALWDILKPKSDPTPTDRIDGDGGE